MLTWFQPRKKRRKKSRQSLGEKRTKIDYYLQDLGFHVLSFLTHPLILLINVLQFL